MAEKSLDLVQRLAIYLRDRVRELPEGSKSGLKVIRE